VQRIVERAQTQQTRNDVTKKFLVTLIYLMFLFVLVEIFSFAIGKVLQGKWSMYRDPIVQDGKNAVSYDEYLKTRDPDLGWPRAEDFGKNTYDHDGARWCLDSGVNNSERWSISLYGDSFTADKIGGNTDHWGCRLQRLTGTKTKNYGVGGYGTDQALIRYLNNKEDGAEVVILAHMSDDISRNLTRYRDFLTYSQDWAFKPRFVIDKAGKLKNIPMPTLTSEDYNRFIGLQDPQLILPHENFHPNGPSGAVRLTFPYTLSIIRNFDFWELQSRLAGKASYAAFYSKEHPFKGLQITTAIMLRFVQEAKLRGQSPLLVLFPGQDDLNYYRENKRWHYQNLIDALREEGQNPINFGETLLTYLDGRPVNEAFGKKDPHHYNLEVSHLVADTVLERIKNNDILTFIR